MTITQFEYLLAVAHHGHFRKAAQSCGVTQPTLSMQIQKLEEQLGVKIFDRSQSPIVPTEVGERIIKQARVVVQESAKIPGLIHAHPAPPSPALSGTLRLGLCTTITPGLMPQAIPSLLAAHPALHLHVQEGAMHGLMDLLAQGTVDMVLGDVGESSGAWNEVPLWQEKLQVYFGTGHPLLKQHYFSPTDLAMGEAWLLHQNHALHGLAVALCQNTSGGIEARQLNYGANSLETLVKLVDQWGGFCILPASASAMVPVPKREQLRTFQDTSLTRKVSLVAAQQNESIPPELFAQALMSALPPHLTAQIDLLNTSS